MRKLTDAQITVKMWLEGGDYSILALSHAEDRYKPNKRELDELLEALGVIRNWSGIQVPKREHIEKMWAQIMTPPPFLPVDLMLAGDVGEFIAEFRIRFKVTRDENGKLKASFRVLDRSFEEKLDAKENVLENKLTFTKEQRQ
jgi:hypothetical protein